MVYPKLHYIKTNGNRGNVLYVTTLLMQKIFAYLEITYVIISSTVVIQTNVAESKSK